MAVFNQCSVCLPVYSCSNLLQIGEHDMLQKTNQISEQPKKNNWMNGATCIVSRDSFSHWFIFSLLIFCEIDFKVLLLEQCCFKKVVFAYFSLS